MSKALNTNLTLNVTELVKAMEAAMAVQQPIMIWGPPGIGKSDVAQQVATAQKRPLVDLRLLLLEPTDLRGIPYFDNESKTMKWAAPNDLPFESNGELSNAILFLDEINAAPPSVQAASYQLILNRRLGENRLGAGVDIMAAGNRETDRGVTYRMPSPLANRFLHLELEVNFNAWLKWAVMNHINRDVVGFLNWQKGRLFDFDPRKSERAFATPRTWSFVSKILDSGTSEDSILKAMVAGCVGDSVAAEFMHYRKIASQLPDPTDILHGRVKQLKVNEISTVYALIIGLCYALSDINKRVVRDGQSKPVDPVTDEQFHEYGDNYFRFLMENVEPEMAILGGKTVLGIHALPFNHTKLKSFKAYYTEYKQYLVDND